MANGEMKIGDVVVREIEKTLELPLGWMDRDNIALLHMKPPEFDLYRIVARYSDDAKIALMRFLSSL